MAQKGLKYNNNNKISNLHGRKLFNKRIDLQKIKHNNRDFQDSFNLQTK